MKTVKQSDSRTDGTESVDLDSKLVPYPEVFLDGLYFSAVLSNEDFWSKIMDLL